MIRPMTKSACDSSLVLGYNLYINVRPRDGTVFVCSRLHSVRFGQLLCCAHKRIVNIMKVYIERKNMQVQLITFRKLC